MPGHSNAEIRSYACPPANQENDSHPAYPAPNGISFRWRGWLFVALKAGQFIRVSKIKIAGVRHFEQFTRVKVLR
jgi:hypothetical protein